MKLKFCAASILTILSTASYAASKDGVFTVLQRGNDSCGSFTAAAQKGTHQNNWAQWNLYTTYAMGYFTGVNTYEQNTISILGNTDTEGVMGNIEKYCNDNPLKTFLDALDATAVELYPNRKK